MHDLKTTRTQQIMTVNSQLPTIQSQQPLNQLCTFGIGGPAKWYVETHTIEHMQSALQYASKNQLRTLILGNGSNILFDDEGFDGIVIHNKISFCNEISKGVFFVGAGYKFSRLGVLTARKGWSGLEFASGIPGTVGGAVFMNAGANGAESSDCLVSVDFIHQDGKKEKFNRDSMHFSYRKSPFHNLPGAIVSATFRLTESNGAKSKQNSIIRHRTETQPYGKKSAGCIFRNPPLKSAGALIDSCGLKGKKVGGAGISTKHGNFVINSNHATCEDVLLLIKEIQTVVRDRFGIELEPEVRYIPYHEESI